jgi:2,4-dichlorophenol 6-monooxygenase
MLERNVPVLIVGAGGSGLAASIFLSDAGVESLLVERHETTSPQPKAHILNGRTMEILAQHGLAEEIYRQGSPPEQSSAMVWLTSLGGSEPYDRRVLHRTDAYGGGLLAGQYEAACGHRHGNLGQRWLEPLMRAHAEERPAATVLFGHELVSVEQDDDGVRAVVRRRADGEQVLVRAAYLIAADGGRTVGPALGVGMVGVPTFLEWVNLHVRADFSAFMAHDDAIVNRVCSLDDETGRLLHCGVVPMGPKQWGRHSEEWTLMFARPPGSARGGELDDAAVEDLVRRSLKLPGDHPMEIESISRWPVEGTVADRFSVGRVFLVGDAAHRHPPSGALGLNTGIQDSHNLCWKLAAVLAGTAPPALLDGYGAERRPVALQVVERALFSLFNQIAMTAGTGVVDGADPSWNRSQYTALFADTADGRTRRAVLHEYFETNRITSGHLGLEMGHDYADAGFVLPDGSSRPDGDPLGLAYPQCARPGHRMPHAWLSGPGGRVSTHELLEPGRFLLVADGSGEPWRAPAAERGVVFARVGAELADPDGTWARLRAHGEGGALLVRPDGVVAARFGPVPDPAAALAAGLRAALGADR